MFDISFDKIVVILVIAAFLIGPKKLPVLASQLAALAGRLRELGGRTREQVTKELGPEFAEIEWRKLDPRQYDPRRIIRDALLEAPTYDTSAFEVPERTPLPTLTTTPVPSNAPANAPVEETHAAGDRPDSDR